MQMAKCLEYFNTLSCQNYFFPEGMGGVQNSSGNSRGVGGGVILAVQKMEILARRGGLCEIPSVLGVWIYIFSGTTYYLFICLVHEVSKIAYISGLTKLALIYV